MNNTIALKKASRFLPGAGLLLAALLIVIIPTVAHADTFNTLLRVGTRGTEVRSLQTLLATDADLYPQGLVTGYFGSMTKAAVIKFQIRNGLGRDGIVGPVTRAALNAFGGGDVGNNGQAPIISNAYVNAGRNNASVIWSTNVPARGMVYYSPTPLTTYEHENSVDVSGFTAIDDSQDTHTSQNVSLLNLQANTTYYYLIYTTGQNGNVTVTWPATFRTSN